MNEKTWHWTDWLLLLPLVATAYLIAYTAMDILFVIFAGHNNTFLQSFVAMLFIVYVTLAVFSKPPIDWETKYKIKESRATRNN